MTPTHQKFNWSNKNHRVDPHVVLPPFKVIDAFHQKLWSECAKRLVPEKIGVLLFLEACLP